MVLLSTAIFTVTIHKVPYGHFKDLVNNSMVERLFHDEPCACMERCLAASDDGWFAEHFRKVVPPVLSLNNSVLPNHKWWQVLAKCVSHLILQPTSMYSKLDCVKFRMLPNYV